MSAAAEALATVWAALTWLGLGSGLVTDESGLGLGLGLGLRRPSRPL